MNASGCMRLTTVYSCQPHTTYLCSMNLKKPVVVLLMLFIASLFLIGADWAPAPIPKYFHFYFADIAIPFGFYFLLSLMEDRSPLLKRWFIKAILIFGLCSLSEFLQYFGIYALASVFDPIDFLMYALGVSFAACIDRLVFKRIFRFWD